MSRGSVCLKVDFTVVKLRHSTPNWQYLEAMHPSLRLKETLNCFNPSNFVKNLIVSLLLRLRRDALLKVCL